MPRAPSTDRSSDNARQPILDAAIRLFARQGYAGTSIQDILDEVHLSKPALYYHFKSKAGLYRAILDHAFDECFRLIQQAVTPLPPGEEQLVAVATALFDFANQHGDLTRLVFASLFAAPGEIPSECVDPAKRRRTFDKVQQLLTEARTARVVSSRPSVPDLAHGLIGSISHRVRTHLLAPSEPLDVHLARRVVGLFLDGARS